MDSKFFLKALKAELKKQKRTYKDLSKSLKMTEAGIKKIFAREDLSFNRACEICQTLGISIQEILKSAETEIAKEKVFTEKQEKFLLAHPSYFHFFMRLAYEQRTPEEIQKETSISAKSAFKYLKKLDELGLIILHPNNRVAFPDGFVSRVNTQKSPLESLKYEATQDFLDRMKKAGTGLLGGGTFYMSKEQIESFHQDMMEVLMSYSRQASAYHSRKNHNEASTIYTVMVAQAPLTLFGKISSLD